MLDDANSFHPNIKLTRQIGTSLPFLDVFIENQTGILTTSVYHKEALTSYHLNLIIHVMCLGILSTRVFFVPSDTHQQLISSILNNNQLKLCYFIMGLFSIFPSSL